MDRATFERILAEEGIDDGNLRAMLWHSRPEEVDKSNDEERVRAAAKKFNEQLPTLLMRQALNRAMDREFGREE